MINERYIIASAQDQSKLLDATQALANLYHDSEFADEIRVSQNPSEDGQYVIKFPNQLDFEHFKYFVNYLHYPETAEFGVNTKGYWTIKEQDGLPEKLLDSRVMLYISKHDTEYDNVSSAFDSTPHNYKLGFASGEEFVKLSSSEPAFLEKAIDHESFDLIATIFPNKEVIEIRSNANRKRLGCLVLLPIIALAAIGLIYGL